MYSISVVEQSDIAKFQNHLHKCYNCPKLVQELFDEHAGGVKMIVASRHEATPVFHITSSASGIQQQPARIQTEQLQFDF